jgi:hypothetical protein
MVMEIKWLSNLLSSLKPIENDGKFPCVSETTKVMSISESEQIVAQQKLGSVSTTHIIMSPPTHTLPHNKLDNHLISITIVGPSIISKYKSLPWKYKVQIKT